MDDLCFAYFSLVREYASRPLQGFALHYEGLYGALVSQTLQDEQRCRNSVIEFLNDGSRSRTLHAYDDLKTYLDADMREHTPKKRRLFILEDLPVRWVCLLGSRLRIHPAVFARHFSSEDSSTIPDNLTSFPSEQKSNTEDGLALRETQASNAQARSVQWLTTLGTFFLPLSVVAGVLSMGGEFLPGESKFWVYFAVVVPLLVVISVLHCGKAGDFILAVRSKKSEGSFRKMQ